MKATEKLRATWCKKERSILYHYPLGSQTKCDASFLSGHVTDAFARELEKRGYDKTTLRFSIEPKKGNEALHPKEKNPMAVVNCMSRMPTVGDVVKSVSSDGVGCIDITFECGKSVAAHFELPQKEEDNEDTEKVCTPFNTGDQRC